jgi:uncharacterized RDD family membrane protein YckC
VVVPEATPEVISAGEEFIAEPDANHPIQINLDEELSEDEIFQMAWEAAEEHARANASPSALVCSRWKRFFGAMIDAVAGITAMLAGLLLAVLMRAIGGNGSDLSLMVVALTIPAMLGTCQCYMIATEGRTIGKYCVKSKIVNLVGQPPGFFQGIVMRIFAVALLGIIPLFGLINILWIFNEPKRCLHDYIAGTYVIDA